MNILNNRSTVRRGLGFPNELPSMAKLFFVMGFPLFWLTGCLGLPSPQLPGNFNQDPKASEVIQQRLSENPQGRLPVGVSLVVYSSQEQASATLDMKSWPTFLVRVKDELQQHAPVSLQEGMRLDDIPNADQIALLREMGERQGYETILLVLTSARERSGPAQFDVMPEVSMMNGQHIENHATVELGLMDLKSGKMLLQSHGTSYATLERLDVPLSSNRYPRVRGSSMTKPLFPDEANALETVRMVALNEALDQAIMKFSNEWKQGQGKAAFDRVQEKTTGA